MLFLTTQANLYTVVPVNEDFFSSGVYNTTYLTGAADVDRMKVVGTANDIFARLSRMGNFETLSPHECFEAYHTQYMSSRGDVLVVQQEPISPTEVWVPSGQTYNQSLNSETYLGSGFSPYLYTADQEILVPSTKHIPYQSDPTQYPSYEWQCTPLYNKTCSLDRPRTDGSFTWGPYGNATRSCLSEKVVEQCKLNYSLQFAVIVVIFNLAKVICMFLTLWRHDPSVLITIGDAIQSFLDRPDTSTQGFCAYSDHHIQLLVQWQKSGSRSSNTPNKPGSDRMINRTQEAFLENPRYKQWRPRLRRWWSAVPIIRWFSCGLL
ncbi:MAG: hypothetical protein Q9170_005667 [Blastenia crenularia]